MVLLILMEKKNMLFYDTINIFVAIKETYFLEIKRSFQEIFMMDINTLNLIDTICFYIDSTF